MTTISQQRSQRSKTRIVLDTESSESQIDDYDAHQPTPEQVNKKKRREVSLYDVVSGRIGTNGFMTEVQVRSDNYIPLAPHEVLNQRRETPDNFLNDYDADESLSVALPGSDLLKTLHSYVSEFYGKATANGGKYDFKSLDETALLALGYLMEEAAAEALGENGDMVLVDPGQSEEHKQEESVWVRHQVRGVVRPVKTPEYGSSVEEEESEMEERPRKRKRSRKGGLLSDYEDDETG